MTAPIHAVFIGSSNGATGTWPEIFCDRQGWVCHNYSVPGGGFCSGEPGKFITQMTAAVNATGYDPADVDYVFIVDSGNDIRAPYSVAANAPAVFTLATSFYPNARVITIPVLWGWTDMNRNTSRTTSLTQRVQEIREAALPLGVEVVEWSWTWHYDSPDWMRPVTSTESGVHYTPAGYMRVVYFVEKYLRGENTDSPIGWKFITPNTAKVSWTNAWVKARRDGNTASVQGSLTLPAAVGMDVELGTLPVGLTPPENVRLNVVSNTRLVGTVDIFNSGLVRSFSALAADTWNFNSTYPVF